MAGTLQVGGVTLGTHNSGTGKVDLTNAGTANITSFNAGTITSAVNFPTGHILQVHSASYGGAQTSNQSYASGNFTDMTNMSISLTPSSSTNYLLIVGNINGYNLTSSYAFGINLHISGGGSDGSILLGDATGSRTRIHAGGPTGHNSHGMQNYAIGGRIRLNESIPNWSSGALTVKVQFATNDTSHLAITNRAGNQANNTGYTTPISTFTVMEVVG